MLYVRYNDLWLRIIAALLAAHFIVMYGEEKSIFEVLLMRIYYIAMAGSFLIAFLLMCFVRWTNLRLDRKFDWRKRPVERIALQLLFGVIIPALMAFLLATSYFAIRGMNILNTLYLRIDYPVIVVLIIVLNLYYLCFYFYGQMKIAEQMLPVSPVSESEAGYPDRKVFLVSHGPKNIPVPLEDVAYFFKNGSNILRTSSGEDFVVTQSLDEIEQYLPRYEFFRANRQTIVHRKACRHFEQLPYSKLELFVHPQPKQPIIISQKKCRKFLDWISTV